ncbi:MAG: TonB-dependent receptor, partial [Alphaproteobacteria bacterium]|nr:TonB-dependent receptor [Alphaproteobacteria bacterium]
DFTPDISKDEWTQAALTIHGKLGLWDVTYAGGYFERHFDTQQDYSDYSVNYQNHETAVGYAHYYNSFIQNGTNTNLNPSQLYHGHDDYTKQSHEFRISSPTSNPLRVTLGAFYQRQTDRIYADYIVPGLANTYDPTTSFYQASVPNCNDDVFCSREYRIDRDYAIFGDAAYDILPNLTLDAGIRGFKAHNSLYGWSGSASKVPGTCLTTNNNTDIPCVNVDKGTVQYGETHKVNLSWKIDKDRMLYATYSTGYRPGGVNRLPGVNPYVADTLTNYEIGFKSAWLQHKLYINIAIFDEEWKNVQYGEVTPGANGVISTYNVGNARVKGVEGDFTLNEGGLTLSGSGSYIDGQLTSDFCNISAATGNPDCTLGIAVHAGTALPVQPKFKGTLSARYHFDLGSWKPYVQISGNHQSGVRSALDDASAAAFGYIPGFSTLDASLGAVIGKWHWELFMTNVTDERGILSLNSACVPSACASLGRAYPVKPQEFGLKLGSKF